MKNIKNINLEKHNNEQYLKVENGIFKDVKNDSYVFGLNYELEDNEDSQYPLEDILDKFYLHVSDFIDEDSFYSSKIINIELGGELEDIQNAIKTIIGKRVYNLEHTEEDGKTYAKLVIE